MKLLIDADYIVYKVCASAEDEVDFGKDIIFVTSKFSDVQKQLKRNLSYIEHQFPDADETILFFSSSDNFRKKIMEDYKGHRNRKKPCGYMRAINWLRTEYTVKTIPTLEADDVMGIYATKYPGNVIVSPDKDMRQIPGLLYDLTNPVTNITEFEGYKWHLIQTMAGDQTDGYAGIPGYGVKKATTCLEEEGYEWSTVLNAFLERDLTEEDALVNARLAKILTKDEFDFKTKKPILWNPAKALSLAK